MKQIRMFLFYGMMIAALVLAVQSVAGAKTRFMMNHQFPEDTAGSKLDQWFADEVAKATEGEVEIKIWWSNTLGAAKENLKLLSTGVIDMAAMSSGYFPSELPFFSAPNSLPMSLDDICQSGALMKAFMTQIPEFSEEAKRNHIRPLFFHLLNPYLLVSKKPVEKFEDLKGLQIRIWGEDMPRLVQAAGGKPVNLFLPDIYRAMESDVLDACPFSPDMAVSYKIYELAKHVTEVVLWEGPSWGVWISEKAWEKISPEHQKRIMELSDQILEKELISTREAETSARDFLQKQGVTFHSFPPADLEKWKQASPDFFADWIKKMEALGKGDAARQTVTLWKEIRNTVSCGNNASTP
ncbi:MAG: TRAP transporter substrate-binding protein DctP [Desulfococcaceae bacterium]